MKKFADLYVEQSKAPSGKQSAHVNEAFRKLLSESRSRLCDPGSQPTGRSRRVVIGVATWSGYDMHLLDDLIETAMNGTRLDEDIEIFDLSCASISDLDEYVPGVENVYHSPVVGIWENGALVERMSGAKARELIADRYNLSHS